MQRLHEADLTGNVLERGDFEHLCLPAEPTLFLGSWVAAAKIKNGWASKGSRRPALGMVAVERDFDRVGGTEGGERLSQTGKPGERIVSAPTGR